MFKCVISIVLETEGTMTDAPTQVNVSIAQKNLHLCNHRPPAAEEKRVEVTSEQGVPFQKDSNIKLTDIFLSSCVRRYKAIIGQDRHFVRCLYAIRL